MIDVIQKAQRLANAHGVRVAVVGRRSKERIVPASIADSPLEICHPVAGNQATAAAVIAAFAACRSMRALEALTGIGRRSLLRRKTLTSETRKKLEGMA